jgi:hypothetical protein
MAKSFKMTDKQKEDYVDVLINGDIPDQETFTKEETLYIAQAVCAWAASQITFAIDDCVHEKTDLPSLVANCEFKTIEEGISSTEDLIEEELCETADFVLEHFI